MSARLKLQTEALATRHDDAPALRALVFKCLTAMEACESTEAFAKGHRVRADKKCVELQAQIGRQTAIIKGLEDSLKGTK